MKIKITLILFTLVVFACVKDEQIPIPITEFIIEPRVITSLPNIVYESSGIHVTGPNVIWTHNDSGHTNQLFQIDTTGNLVRILTVVNATNVDWEDLAVDNQGRVYINDAGNNANDRKDLVIYRIPDPDIIEGFHVEAERIDFVFEDQTQFPPPVTYRNFCIEATIWKDDSIFMFTKDRSNPITGYTKMYAVPAVPGNHVAVLLDSLYVDNENHPARITAADYNPATGEMVLLTRTRVLSFTDFPGNRFFDGTIIDYQFSHLIGQVEAIAFVTDNRLYITSEGSSSQAGNLFEVIL